MLRVATLLALVLAIPVMGCAARRDRAVDGVAAEDDGAVLAAASTALVFRAPATLNEPPLDLARAPRQASAFVGYEDPIVETYDVLTIDRQVGGGWGYGGGRFGNGFGGGYLDRYERRAVTEKTGALHR